MSTEQLNEDKSIEGNTPIRVLHCVGAPFQEPSEENTKYFPLKIEYTPLSQGEIKENCEINLLFSKFVILTMTFCLKKWYNISNE